MYLQEIEIRKAVVDPLEYLEEIYVIKTQKK